MWSPPEVARRLGTSLPRVHRAARSLGIDIGSRGSRTRLTTQQARQIAEHLGFAPDVPGLSREDLFVLAALSRRPLGLRSSRSVARSSSVSPVTAASSLGRLQALGIVRHTVKRVVEGEVVEAPVWEVDWASPRWREIRSVVRRVILPYRAISLPTPRRVPRRLHHLFWNADPWALDVERDADYLAARILASDDAEANAWMATHLSADAIARAGRMRGLDSRRRDLSTNLSKQA